MKSRFLYVALTSFLGAALFVSCSHSPVENYFAQRDPASISSKERKFLRDISKASTAELEIESSRLLIDNDAAFDAKLDAIKNAKSGETVRIIYYIYSDSPVPDITTSVFSKALLDAANRGVKVKLLLDFFTNYRVMDHLKYLEYASKGNIEVRLYGRPTDLVLRDLYFIAQPCPKTSAKPSSTECSDAKWAKYEREVSRHGKPYEFADFYSSLLAAGMYSKAASVLKTGFLYGSELDIEAIKGGTSDPKQAEAFKDLMKIVYDAKIKGDPIAYLKLSMAMVLYPGDVNPALNMVFGMLPIEQMEDSGSGKHWEHLTDFMHQKLILVGDRYLQLGGRNIADSYHMKQNSLSAKYTFMDTDIEATIKSGGDDVADSFDRLWNFRAMTADLKTIEKFMPTEFVTNYQILDESAAQCAKVADRNQRATCITEKLRAHKNYASIEMRMGFQQKNMMDQIAVYNSKYLPTKKYTESFRGDAYRPMSEYSDALADSDMNSYVSYVENVHYDPKNPQERNFGGIVDKEIKQGNGIHAIWVEALENVCKTSREEGVQKRVIFHSAYWLPPANLLKAFTNMMNGSWDCRNVKVTFLSNSFDTTDLNIINVFAKYQMKAFFDIYEQRKKAFGREADRKSASFEYYEYLKPANASASQVKSLHTKLTVIGDSVLVGSANADVRSFYMDANNGLFIHGATEFASTYTAWIDSILAKKNLTKNVSSDFRQSLSRLNRADSMFMDALRARFKSMQKIPASQYATLKKTQQEMGNELYEATMAMLHDGALRQVEGVKYRPGQDLDRAYERARDKVEKIFNRTYMLF